jgi:hypothetical protein
MTASTMREDVMVRLSGMGRLAVLLAVVVAALSLACAGDAAELTSTDIPNTGTPTAAAAASPPAARTVPSAVPPEGVATVNLDEIKEQVVRDLFDDSGRMVNPDQRLARIAAEHKGGFGGYYFDETDRSTAYVYMLDPSQTEAAKAAFRAAYRGGGRQVDRIIPVQGDYAFNDLLEWFHVLDVAMVENGIHPSTGGVREISNRIRFGLEDIGQATDARRIMSDLDIPQGAVVFEKEKIKLLAN